MNKSEKIWMISMLSSLIIVIVIGLNIKLNFPDSGLSQINEYDDLAQHDIQIMDDLGSVNEELTYNQYANHMEDIIKLLTDSAIVAVVKPTGRLEIGEDSIGQEFITQSIFEGNLTPGDTAMMYSYVGFSVDRSKIRYNDAINLMNPQNNYLVFMEESQLNQFTAEKNYKYKITPGYFSLSETKPLLFSGSDRKWITYQDTEFFVSSKRILDKIYNLKEVVLANYGF